MREPAEVAKALAVASFPLAVAAAWTTWCLARVDAIEREVRPLSGLAYATFVQLAHHWSIGAGWVQSVHRGYAEEWRWGGHHTPLLFVTASLSSFSDSPWALARVQVVAVGVGGLAAWRLGRAEAGLGGGLVGLALYFGSAPVALLALADYQDLVLVLPALVLAVWASRHASALGFVAAGVLLGATREEGLLLLPLVGLSGGVNRAVLGSLVSAGYLLFYQWLGPSSYPSPLMLALVGPLGARERLTYELPSLSPHLYGAMSGAAWPWLAAAPVTALPAAAVAVFHAHDATSVAGVGSPGIHHLAPLTAGAIAAGIVGACGLMRVGRAAALVVVLAVAGGTWSSWVRWEPTLLSVAFRGHGAGEHPAWALLADVPPDVAILVPNDIAPVAARRRWVVTLDSLGEPGKPTSIRFALDQGTLEGTVIAERGGWRLLQDPVLPVLSRPGDAARAPAAPAIGTQGQ